MRTQLHIGCTRKLNQDLLREAAEKGVLIQDQDVLDIQYLVQTEIAECLTNYNVPFVFTSAHALKALEQNIKTFGLKPKSKTAFCITGKTSEKALQMGFEILAEANDSLSLAHKIAADFTFQNLIHSGSNIDMKRWKNFLLEKGIRIESLKVYHKTAAPKSFHAPDGMLFFSPSQVEIFFSNNNLKAETPAFCIGETTASALVSRQHQLIITPEKAATENLLNRVYQFFQLS